MAAPPSASATTIPVVLALADGSLPASSLVETDVAAIATAAAAAMTPTLAAAAGKTTYVSYLSVDGLGATAGSVIDVTITGLLGGTVTRKLTVPAGVAVAVASPLVIYFSRPRPASAVNTAIVLNVPSFGAGNTSAVANIHGFQR